MLGKKICKPTTGTKTQYAIVLGWIEIDLKEKPVLSSQNSATILSIQL